MSNARVIDCDVHPMIRDRGEPLEQYLPAPMRRRLAGRTTALVEPLPASRFAHPGGHVLRPDARPPSGGPPGSDPEYVKEDLLDRFEVSAAVLLPLQGAATSAWTNPQEAAALASAFNDYFIEHWLPVDRRFNLAITVAPQDPHTAAEEVRRVGATDGVVSVWVPFLDILIGQRHYHPIFDAAHELGLPITLHGCGTEGMYQGLPSFASGTPTTYAERYVDFFQFGIGHLASIVFEGVLDRFPGLRFGFTEMGWSWLPSTLARLDQAWQASRVEIPWVTRRPSEYVRDCVRFTSQPIEEPEGKGDYVAHMSRLADAEHTLMFSSDYPHWDNDQYTRAIRKLPEDMRDAVSFENAMELYRPRVAEGVTA
ncbi:MAG: amidohydrolase family protein [Thermoleophilaceae bacterium]